jgi:hypothetical protein
MIQPSITPVLENLWIGGFPQPEVTARFDKLILCAEEHQPPAGYFPGVHVLHAPLSPTMVRPNEAQVAVQAGRAVMGWVKRGKSVLVSDAMGYNRSALIAVVALMTRGMPSEKAIELVRGARGAQTLLNPHAITLIRRLEDARALRPSA